jgi:predicted RNA polymerase sigma factor
VLGLYDCLLRVRGVLLARLGRSTEAREEFLAAAALAGNAREREFLLARAAALAH